MTRVNSRERGVVFSSGENRLVGVLTETRELADVGVVILVGGPQYRVGSHRQFVLLARQLGEAGIPVLRFDYAGMGDSEGTAQNFFEVADDIKSAIAFFQGQVEGLKRVVLWGLCDAASEAMIYAGTDARVSALVLLNPWVHSGDYSPEVKFSHYYGPLLKGGDAWRRLLARPAAMLPAMRELLVDGASLLKNQVALVFGARQAVPLIEDMLKGLRQFEGDSLVVLSGQDLTAREFAGLIDADARWRALVTNASLRVHHIEGADHTFSRRSWQEEVTKLTIDWVSQHG